MMRNVLLLAVLSFSGFFLSGCSADFNTVTPSAAGMAIQGRVYGGQQPIVGMHIFLYAAGTGGYGAASSSLLTTSGGYVTSDGGGNFSISGDYATCTANEYLYLYGTGGDPGGGSANSAITLMAPLGLCASGGTLLSTTPDIFMDEVTTVVTAYSLAGWMTAPLQLATDNTTAAWSGLNTAFATASRLENIATGTTYATTPQPATYGLTGTVPQANIDSLANSVAACVNTTGPTSTACDKLFSNALSGGTTGRKPIDTATAIVNIAHHPTANVGNVFDVAGTTVPYQPTLSTAPVDWTLAVPYTANDHTYGDTAGTLTIDSLGNLAFTETQSNVSVLALYNNSLSAFIDGGAGASYGAAIFDTGTNVLFTNYEQGHSGGGNGYQTLSKTSESITGTCSNYFVSNSPAFFPDLERLAFDHAGYLWVLSTGANTVYQVTNDISTCSGTVNLYTASLNAATNLAADSLGNMWFANNGAGNLLKMNTSGTATVYANGGFSGITNLAVGTVGEVIATNASTSLTTLATNGTVTTECTGAAKVSLAVDGANRRWMVNTNNQIETCSAGDAAATTLSGAVNATGPHAIAVDGAGDVWVEAATTTELIGVATPPVLPLATAVANGMIGVRP